MTNLRSKRAAEVRRVVVDFSQKLLVTELLTGTPIVQEVGSADLVITNISLNVLNEAFPGFFWRWPLAPWPLCGGLNALVDHGVAFTVSGGVAGHEYRLRITVGTDATAAQTLIQEITFRVN